MILVDTSVWVDHLRKTENDLVGLLNDGEVCTHPFIIEELACGSMANRKEFLQLLGALPMVTIAEHGEVIELINAERLFGTGLGSVDVHLIASARLSFAEIWSKDKALDRAAQKLGLAAR